MDNNTITYAGTIDPLVGVQAAGMLLAVAQPQMISQRFATQETMKSNAGDTIKWRRYSPWAPATSPLTEGVAPTKQPLVKTDYTAVIRDYGTWAELTSKVVDLHPDNILGVLTKNCADNAAKTVEVLTFNMLKAGTNVFYAGSGITSRATVNATIARKDIQLVVRSFYRNDVQPISNIIQPTVKVSTRGVEASFFGMCHSDLKADLEHLTGWTKVVEYGNPSDSVPGEIGACEGVRFCISRFVTPWLAIGASSSTFLTNGIAGTGAVDVYPIVIVGRDAYGVVRLQGRKSGVQMFICNPGNASPGNELGQKGSVGYRLPWAGAILNEYAVARIECAATANPNW